MNPLTSVLSEAFRRSADTLEPRSGTATPITPERVEAWITIESVRGQTRWLDAAVAAAQPESSLGPGSDEAWLKAWCKGWGSRAAPAFRKRADALAGLLAPHTGSVGALLAYWRITGRRRWFDRAFEGLPPEASPGNWAAAEAFRQAWRATADDKLRLRSIEAYGPTSLLPLSALPGAAEVIGRDGFDEEFLRPLLAEAAPETIVPVAAALGLPLLQLEVQWWLESELSEGPVAEAVTFPWPALELSFSTLPERDQVRFLPTLDGRAFEPILDAGVVGAGLREIVSEADRSAFLRAAGAHRRSIRRR